MVKIVKTWETIFFCAEKKGSDYKVSVELSINHDTGKYNLCTPHQEMVSFKDDTIEMSELKLEAVTAAIKYIKSLQK
jgi:hypothetical protein